MNATTPAHARDRRIGMRHFTWWAVQSIALAMFVVGRQL
jgi:hypothetical protein